MSVRRAYATGAYATGEQSMVMTASRYSGGGPIVLVIPGVAGVAFDYTMDATRHIDWWRRLTRLAEAGCVVCVGTFAAQGDGGSSWGNLAGRDLLDDAIAMCSAAPYDGDSSRIGILADSEGGDLGLNYAWRHTDDVLAVVTYLTPPDVDSLYNVNVIVEDTVDTAFADYGGWEANKAAHDPALNHASITPIADRIRMYYSTNDGLAPEADHLALAASTGVEVGSLGAIAHDVGTTGVVDLDGMIPFMVDRLF